MPPRPQSLGITLAALALAACAGDEPTAPTTPRAPARAAATASPQQFTGGQWAVSLLFPWAPYSGAASVGTVAVNDRGQVLGVRGGTAFRVTPGGGDAELFDGSLTPLALNNQGDALLRDGTAPVIIRPGGARVPVALSDARDVSDRGQVVGTAGPGQRAAVWTADGGTVLLTGPAFDGAQASVAYGINPSGTIVVGEASNDVTGAWAFVWTPERGAQRLAMAAKGESHAYDVNDAGTVVGYRYDVDGPAAVTSGPVAWTPAGEVVWLSRSVVGPNPRFGPQVPLQITNSGLVLGATTAVGEGPYLWESIRSDPVDVVAQACAAAPGSPQCIDLVAGVPGRMNERGEIGGLVRQLPDGRSDYVYNPVVWRYLVGESASEVGPVVSASSGKCVDVPNGTTVPGASIILWRCHGGENQRVTAPVPGGSGPLRVLGLCLALRGDPDYTDAVVTAACEAGSPAQTWTRRADGTLFHAASGRCLDVFGEQTADLTPIWLWHCSANANQRWTVGGPPPVAGQELVSLDRGACLTVSGEGAGVPAAATDCTLREAQRVSAPVPGTTGEIRVAGDRCIDIEAGAAADGVRIIAWPCHGGPNQRWEFLADGHLRSPLTGKCIAARDPQFGVPTPLLQWGCEPVDNQRWYARPQRVETASR